MTNTQFAFSLDSNPAPIMPATAYHDWFTNLANNDTTIKETDSLLDLNGMPETMFSFYPELLTSREKTWEVWMPYFATEYRAFYPRLDMFAKQLPKPERIGNHNLITSIREAHKVERYEEFFKLIRFTAHEARAYNAAHSVKGAFDDFKVADDNTDVGRLMASVKPGDWGERSQRLARGEAMHVFGRCLTLLGAYAQESRWVFRMRHPIAYFGQETNLLYRSNTPISTLLFNIPQHRLEFLKWIHAHYPYNPFTEQPNYRSLFNHWARINATAVFERLPVNGEREYVKYAMTPYGMPAVVANRMSEFLPVTTAALQMPADGDMWQRIEYLSHDCVQEGKMYSAYSAIPESILLLGWLACMALSILSVNRDIGRGSRHIYWTHGTLNAATVQHFVKIAPWVLNRAEKEMELV